MAYLQDVEIDWNTFKVVAVTLAPSQIYYLMNDLQYVPFIIQESTSPMVGQSVYYCGVNRDPKAVSGEYAALTSGTKGSAVIQGITYTATAYGPSLVTIEYVVDAPSMGHESVTVLGNAITVHIAVGTIAQMVYAAVAAWNAYNGNPTYNSQAAAYLASAVILPGQEGLLQTVQAPTPLAGGTPAVTTISDWETNYMTTAVKVPSFSVGVGLEL